MRVEDLLGIASRLIHGELNPQLVVQPRKIVIGDFRVHLELFLLGKSSSRYQETKYRDEGGVNSRLLLVLCGGWPTRIDG